MFIIRVPSSSSTSTAEIHFKVLQKRSKELSLSNGILVLLTRR